MLDGNSEIRWSVVSSQRPDVRADGLLAVTKDLEPQRRKGRKEILLLAFLGVSLSEAGG